MRTLNFEELNVSKSTIDGLEKINVTEATSLQQAILSNIANEKDLVVNPKEKSDKVTAISIAAIEDLQREDHENPSVLVITDTPENIGEIEHQITAIGLPQEGTLTMIGDNGNKEEQAEAIRQEPGIILANPDRLQDLLQEHRFIFRHINLLVLDNAENMIADGKADSLKQIRRRILSDYRTVVCANEYNSEIKKAISGFTDEPVVLGFGNSEQTKETPPSIAGNIKQGYINVPYRMKISTLMAHLKQNSDDRCVIFTASKRGTDRLYRVLKKQNMKATSLHDKLSDEKRAQRFSNFTNGDVQYLLIADISAAELDLKSVNQVINYDVPNSSDEYRFRATLLDSGKSVQIVSLVSKQDRSDISELQNELGETPDEIPLPNEVKKKLKERKKNKSSNGQQKKKRGGRQKKKDKDKMELPRPSYDKLSGGRTGNHDEEKTGIVKFFKKLFS